MSHLRSYLDKQPIVAVSSLPGGAIALVRVSGEEVVQRLAPMFKRAISDFKPREFCVSELQDFQGRVLDQAGVLHFPKEKSYTGEDLCELHLHGNPYVVQRVLEEILRLGFRQALAGEFTFRAFQNGKMDLTQIEGLRDLLEASNDVATDLAVRKINGWQSEWIEKLGESLRTVLVLAEAGIDFSDQDLDEVSLPRLKGQLREILVELREASLSFQRGRKIQEGYLLTLAGAPNAGKSTLFNELLGEDRAIVSDVPGTTRDVLREKLKLQLDGRESSFVLLDTAGIRSADPVRDQVEAIGIERSREALKRADVILFVVSGTEIGMEIPQAIHDVWKDLVPYRQKVIGVLTKSDLIPANEVNRRKNILAQETGLNEENRWVVTSSIQHQGFKRLTEILLNFVDPNAQTQVKAMKLWVTREEQKLALDDAIQRGDQALEADQIDLFAADVRSILNALSSLLGETSTDSILNRIFSQFCIGK